jgi:hypothetical protein
MLRAETATSHTETMVETDPNPVGTIILSSSIVVQLIHSPWPTRH